MFHISLYKIQRSEFCVGLFFKRLRDCSVRCNITGKKSQIIGISINTVLELER